jgi:hypothetical protein
MKRSLLTKRISVYILALLVLTQISIGQVLYEGFNYTIPGYIGGNGNAGSISNNWTTHSVTTGQTTTLDLYSGSLSYTGMAAPTGNKGLIFGNANATSRDVNRAFSTSSTVIYFSALINIVDNSQITAIGDYFMHVAATSGTTVTVFGGRLGVKSVNAGANFRFMIQNTSGGTPTYTEYPEDMVFGVTYLVVVKFDRSASPTAASLWVNPLTIGGSEPVGSVTNNSGTGTFTTFASICLRNNATTPKAEIDEIYVGETFASVTPGVDNTPPTALFNPGNSSAEVLVNVIPTITFNEPIFKTDGFAVTDADLASLVTFKKTSSTGDPVTFTATISASKKVITVTPSATLDNSQVYYLAIGAVKDASGNQTTGSNITFTTIAAATPTITLTYPVGGEVMYAGQAAAITWTSANITNVFVEVFAPDNDVSRVFSWIPFVPTTPAAAGHVDIVVPPDAPYGTVYKIRISDLDNPAVISTGSDFTVIPVATSLTDLRARCIVNDIVKLSSEVTMTFKRATGNQKYIQDANAGLLIYDPSAVLTTTLAVGDNFTGLEGKIATYGGVLEIIPTKTTVNITSSGNTVTIPAMTVLDFNTNYATYESMLIKITNVSFPDATGTATFAAAVTTPLYTVTDGTNSVAFYTFKSGEGDIVGSVIPAGKYDVTALALRFNTTPQIASRTIADFQFLTGIERTTDIKAELYPVPATDLLQVRNIRNVKTYEILDATGRMIRKSNVSSDSDLNIPVSELKHGIYYIRFNTPDGRVIRKFIK